MVDILNIAANTEKNEVTTCYTTTLPNCVTCYTTQSSQISGNTANICLSASNATYYRCKPFIDNYPWCTQYWNGISSLATVTGDFKVCDTSGLFRCGSTCSWTVPAGASIIRFQIWGPGSSSGMGCCCGGAPFGTTGAYASVIIPAVVGCTYSLTGGCAVCCYSCWGSGGIGQASSVTGYGLCNFCVEGGYQSLYYRMYEYSCTFVGYKINSGLYGAGACLCNSCTDYCAAGCSTCGMIGFTKHGPAGVGGNWYGCTIFPSSIVQGINGIHSAGCFDTNHYGSWCHPPIYGFESTSQCVHSWTSVSCGGCICKASTGKLQIPGAGGWASIKMGGTNTCAGDAGRMGMVCVQWA